MTPLHTSEIKAFQEKILSWYHMNKRDLPWRKLPFDEKTKQRDPYKILISEIMAQQTQLSRVIPKYEAWIQRFPTVESLATAPTREVLLYWSGLGYNRRALNLQKAAKTIYEARIKNNELWDYWPRTYEELVKLPGIGKYTASALLCFAFNEQVAVVDTNVRKVILLEILHKDLDEQEAVSQKTVEAVAEELLPHGMVLRLRSGHLLNASAYDWNQALMDYAAAVLKDKKIRIPKQSAFRTSNRYYRGYIMKVLVRQHTVSWSDLWQYFQRNNPVARERLEAIIQRMEKDGLLRQEGEFLSIV